MSNKLARDLRKNLTVAEQRLWQALRQRQVKDAKFRRQVPIGRYIVDFVCFDKRLIVEVDGGQHQDNVAHDTVRDVWLRQQGFTVLRFWNNEVLGNIEGVLERIAEYL